MIHKMQVLNFGSLNIDHVYAVEHFVASGETLNSTSYQIYAGGKGLNQSVALGRAGVTTFHAGMIGKDGIFLKDTLESAHVDTSYVIIGDLPTGHAVIQVEKSSGQNSILLNSGANMAISKTEMQRILQAMPKGSWLLLQNEINDIPFLIQEGKKSGLKVAINPAPCTESVQSYPLELCDLIMVNEIEASQLTSSIGTPKQMASLLADRFLESEIVITLGKDGALYRHGKREFIVPACVVKTVDTTSAGDTFTGYFMAAKLRNMDAEAAMKCAVFASPITVSRPGASSSIPNAEEVFGKKT